MVTLPKLTGKSKGSAGQKSTGSQTESQLRKLKMLPYVLLGDWMKERRDKYQNLRLQLRRARIPLSFEMYISNSIFYSLLSGIVGAILGLLSAYIIINVVQLPERLTKLTFGPEWVWLLDFKELFVGLLIVVFFTLFIGGIVYSLFMLYPSFQAGERMRSIDRNLPYAVTFMYALSRGGMNLIKMFRALGECKETYGEVSHEIDTMLREMDYFGNDLRTALQNTCDITPSENFKDLMYNLLTVIDSGGNIEAYFRDKSEQYLNKAKIEQKGFLETLALIAESYVTAFVAGPLFIIILGVMMVAMGSGSEAMLYAIVYAVIPIGSLMFVVMINIMTPGETGKAPILPTSSFLKDSKAPDAADPEVDIFTKFFKSKQMLKLKMNLMNPLKPIKEDPVNVLYVVGPIALLYIIVSVYLGISSGNVPPYLFDQTFIAFLDDKIIITFYIIAVPLAFFHEMKRRRDNILQGQIPDLLKKLASTNETGMTMRESLRLISRSDFGAISKELKKMWSDIDWGLEMNDAFKRFSNRIRTHIVSRAITLITKATESSGDVGEVLTVAARDAAAEQELKRERTTNMFIYIIIIYISYFVFVGIVYVISATFLEEMVKAGEKISATSGSGAVALGGFTRAKLNAFNVLFFHAAALQGVCSGMIAGVMGEGSVLSGLKHSIVMLTISYILFTLFVL